MSITQTRHDLMLVFIKNTLEYNAGIVALSTAHIGSMDVPKVQRNFIREYKRFTKEYEGKQEDIVKEIQKLTELSQ